MKTTTIPEINWKVFLNETALENAFGKPEYKPGKRYVSAHTYKRQTSHTRGPWVECPQEEYDSKFEESKRIDLERFMGRYKSSFWSYERKAITPGWPAEIIKQLKKEFP